MPPCHLDENSNDKSDENGPMGKDEVDENVAEWMKRTNYSDVLKEYGNIDDENIKTFFSNLWDGRQIGVDFGILEGLDMKPDWLDVDKLRAGQRFAADFYLPICTSELVCLLFIISNDKVLRKLIWTGKSSDAYTAFKRYLSTGKRVRTWLTCDLFDRNSDGFKNIDIVNRMHSSFYKNLGRTDVGEFVKTTEMDDLRPVLCPFLLDDMRNVDSPLDFNRLPDEHVPMSQTEMTATQLSFIGLVILEPERFGICPVKYADGLEGFVHLWRYLGYRLGTLDEYNLCTGSYKEVQAKTRIFIDFVVKPNMKNINTRWEHMTRSIIDGVHFYTDCFTYETHLMFGLDLLGIDYDKLYGNSSLRSKIQLQLMKLFHNYMIPMSWFRTLTNFLIIGKVDKVSANMPTKQQFHLKVK